MRMSYRGYQIETIMVFPAFWQGIVTKNGDTKFQDSAVTKDGVVKKCKNYIDSQYDNNGDGDNGGSASGIKEFLKQNWTYMLIILIIITVIVGYYYWVM